MNLIQELGIEKCRAIVDGAPELAFAYDSIDCEYMFCGDIQDGYSINDYKDCFDLNDFRTAIAEHEKCQHKWNETTSNGDAYRFFVCKHCDSTQNYVPFESDNCSDIRNHVSPNTKVIER